MKLNIRVTGFLGVIIFWVSACSTPPAKTITHFDCRRYFQSEAIRLHQSGITLNKTLFRNGKKESEKVNDPVWMNELMPFSDIDINKPALLNLYRTDTAYTDGLYTVIYSTMDESVSVKTLSVTMDTAHNVVSVFVLKSSDNMYHHSSDSLEYRPAEGYRLSVSSKPSLGRDILFRMEGRFINPEPLAKK